MTSLADDLAADLGGDDVTVVPFAAPSRMTSAQSDLGTDLEALDGLPDPEVLCSGQRNIAFALARRLLTPTGALAEIGITEDYDSIDVREWLARRIDFTQSVIADLTAQAQQVLSQDERVLSVDVVVTFAAGVLALAVSFTTADGPFSFVLSVDSISATLLQGD